MRKHTRMTLGFFWRTNTVLGTDVCEIEDHNGRPLGMLKREEDARVFCEAATIHFDTDLMPSTVLHQRDKLADLLEQAMGEIDSRADEGHPHWWADAERLLDEISPPLPPTSGAQCLALAERLGTRINDPQALREELQRMEAVQ